MGVIVSVSKCVSVSLSLSVSQSEHVSMHVSVWVIGQMRLSVDVNDKVSLLLSV